MTDAEKRKRKILELTAQNPMRTADLMPILGISESTCNRYTSQLCEYGRLVQVRRGKHSFWASPVMAMQRFGVKCKLPAQESVSGVTHEARFLPAAVVTYCDGVKITRQAAPKGRFDVDLVPGTGVISRDAEIRRGAV